MVTLPARVIVVGDFRVILFKCRDLFAHLDYENVRRVEI